jgi:sulfur dioxygenase
MIAYSDDTIVYPAHNYNGFLMSTIGHEKKFNPNVGDDILKEDFLSNEKLKKRPYPKKFDIAVPRNMNCGRVDN